MFRLAFRFGNARTIRSDRPLTTEELFRSVPNVLGKINMNSVVNVTLTYSPLLYWKVNRKKAFSRSLRVKTECVI